MIRAPGTTFFSPRSRAGVAILRKSLDWALPYSVDIIAGIACLLVWHLLDLIRPIVLLGGLYFYVGPLPSHPARNLRQKRDRYYFP